MKSGIETTNAFLLAVTTGNVNALNQFATEVNTEKLTDYIHKNYYEAYRLAATNNHIDVLLFLEHHAPVFQDKILGAFVYKCFRDAAENGHTAVLKHLKNKFPQHAAQMVSSMQFAAIQVAAKKEQSKTVFYLLHDEACFAYAEEHYMQLGIESILSFFITSKISLLTKLEQEAKEKNPNVRFDLQEWYDVTLCFYMARHLIRRNNPKLESQLMQLLTIPAVTAAAHAEITPQKPNELMQLAINLQNHSAASILLALHSTKGLPMEPGQFQTVLNNNFSLEGYLQHHASTINVISQARQNQIRQINKRYQSTMTTATINQLMQDIHDTLQREYLRNPAVLMVNGMKYRLPMEWIQFNALHLTSWLHQEGFYAYIEHPTHSALRYLSIPNDWMSKQAEFTNSHVEMPSSNWSTCRELQPLLVLFWLVCHEKPNQNGLKSFIKTLALLNRAYNRNYNQQNSAYDDLQSDKPADTLLAKLCLFILIADFSDKKTQTNQPARTLEEAKFSSSSQFTLFGKKALPLADNLVCAVENQSSLLESVGNSV